MVAYFILNKKFFIKLASTICVLPILYSPIQATGKEASKAAAERIQHARAIAEYRAQLEIIQQRMRLQQLNQVITDLQAEIQGLQETIERQNREIERLRVQRNTTAAAALIAGIAGVLGTYQAKHADSEEEIARLRDQVTRLEHNKHRCIERYKELLERFRQSHEDLQRRTEAVLAQPE